MAYRSDKIEAWPDCEVKDFLLPDDQLATIALELFNLVISGECHGLDRQAKRQLVLDLGRVCGIAAQRLDGHERVVSHLRGDAEQLRSRLVEQSRQQTVPPSSTIPASPRGQ